MIIVNVQKRLGNLDLDAAWRADCEVTVLFGPSGAGKTTLLRLIAGLERPDGGRIAVGGRILFGDGVNLKPERRRLGYVFQDAALFPWLTIEENILFALPRQRRGEAWIEELVATFQLGDLLRQRPASLSGGEAQRVALARALAPRPEMLLLDEPFAAVDSGLRVQLRGFVKDIQRNWQIPVIMVTHDLTEAHLVGDRLVRLEHGRVVYEGPVDGLVQRSAAKLMAAY